MHLRKTLYIPISNPMHSAEGSKTSQIATVRRVPAKDLAFFPPGKTGLEKLATNIPPEESACEKGILPSSQSNSLSQILKSFPKTESLLSRLSFDSRDSSLSDEHELQELNTTRSSRDSSDSFGDEARTPKASRRRDFFPTDNEDSCSRLNINDTSGSASFDLQQNNPIVTVQTQPRPFPPMTLSIAPNAKGSDEGSRK